MLCCKTSPLVVRSLGNYQTSRLATTGLETGFLFGGERAGNFSERAGEFRERAGNFSERAGNFSERAGDIGKD